jgi:hypothetical protein
MSKMDFRIEWQDAASYSEQWATPYGPGEGRTEVRTNSVTLEAAPFITGADRSVFDHIKHFRQSKQSFAVPQSGSLEFSIDIEAQTPGTQPGRMIHGCYGPQGSFSALDQPCIRPYAKPTLEGQQASVLFNMTGDNMQLFDWFVSGTRAFALIERLPSSVTGIGKVGLDTAYTQIIKETPITPGFHHFSIRYTREYGASSVDYLIDDKLFSHVDKVGIPLDVQEVPYTGTYRSLGPGELLSIDSFQMGFGLFSVLDAFPFQHPDRPDLSVSIPISERLFGQGAIGTLKNFQVATKTS